MVLILVGSWFYGNTKMSWSDDDKPHLEAVFACDRCLLIYFYSPSPGRNSGRITGYHTDYYREKTFAKIISLSIAHLFSPTIVLRTQ